MKIRQDENDNLYGNLGLDFIDGGFGNDFLMGGQESDFLYGEAGNDTLSGDLGTDYLTGGLDSDLFILSLADANSDPTLADIITDFEPAFDQIGLTDGLTPANLTLELSIDPYLYSSKTLIRVTGSNQILGIVANISPEQLQDHFLSI